METDQQQSQPTQVDTAFTQPSSNEQPQVRSHSNKTIYVFIGLLLVLLIIMLSSIYYLKITKTQPSPQRIATMPNVTISPILNPSPTISTLTRIPTVDKTTGWKIYTSNYEGLSFKYPPTWAITIAAEPVSNGNVYNGDVIRLIAPDGFVIRYEAPDQGQGGGCDFSNYIDQVTALNVDSKKPLYMVLVNHSGNKDLAIYDTIPDDNNDSKNMRAPVVGAKLCYYYPAYTSETHPINQSGNSNYISFFSSNAYKLSDSQFLSLPDTQIATQIFKSLTYK